MKFCVLLYDDMEPIDLATFGVLSMARRVEPAIAITTIAPVAGLVTLANGLKVWADHGYADPPDYDVLIVGGGPGWTSQAESVATLDFLRRAGAGHQMVSVCTGGMILAAAGLLDGKRATTKHEVVPPEISPLETMRQRYPGIRVESASVVDQGEVVTGGGVTLCIDTVLYVLGARLGDRVAAETARIIEYSRAWKANQEALPVIKGAGVP
jgi:transcriptional regulator GlxA family with amidase domain